MSRSTAIKPTSKFVVSPQRSPLVRKLAAASVKQKEEILPADIIHKLSQIKSTLNKHILERQPETEGIILAVMSGVNALFLGDVGTAKTTHIRMAADLLGLSTFDILLSETTKPDHIFGPTDIPALAEGRQVTKIKGYAPDSEVLFFDEVFKANSVVLNPLLWLVNEHLYRNGDDGVIKCPVKAVFGASNEIPSDPVLKAIYDRFLLRFEVEYIKSHNNQKKMITNFLNEKEKIETILSSEEVLLIRKAVRNVKVPEEVQTTVIKIRDQIQVACGYKISDRRLNNSFRVIQAKALLSGRDVANISDAEIVASIFWEKPEHQVKVQAITVAHASSDISDVLSYDELAQDVLDTGLKSGNLIKALKKLRRLYKNVKAFSTKSGVVVANQIRSRIQQVKILLDQRSNFVVVRITTEGKTWYKLSANSASAWTVKQLRSVGFHHRRAGGYWYYSGPSKKLITAIEKKLSVTPAIQDIKVD